jgi:DNA polymerase-1
MGAKSEVVVDPDRRRFLLLDGHSLAYRAFYALPEENFSTSTGQSTNAVYGFTSMLINTLRDEQPSHVAVAFDVSRTTFRTETFPEYKANRAKSPEGFKGQVDLIRDLLDRLGITRVEVPGYEADDVLATLVTQAQNEGLDSFIVTGDRDSLQLVSDNVTVLYPRKGVSDLARMTPDAVVEKYGLTPRQYPDFAALRGDPSDNLPGIPGVGEKTATKWITQYGSLAGLVDNADQITGKVGDALRSALPQVLVNRQLTELVRDVPLDISPADCVLKPIDTAKLDQLLETLEFRALRDRIRAVFDTSGFDTSSDRKKTPPAAASVREVIADGAWAAWLSHVDIAAVAYAGVWGGGTGRISHLAVCPVSVNPDPSNGSASPYRVAIADLSVLGAGDLQAVWNWLGDRRAQLIGHDLKGPLLAMMAQGHSLEGIAFDTALAAYLLAPGQRSPSVGDLAIRYLNRSMSIEGGDGEQLVLAESDGVENVLGEHAAVIAQLYPILRDLLTEAGGDRLLHDVELPVTRILAHMEFTGIAVDSTRLQALSSQFAAEANDWQTKAFTIAGREFTMGSPKQLQHILFEERGLPKTKKIKTGFTTDAESLQSLFARTDDPILECILSWRDVTKLRQTVDGLMPLVDSSGRIHTTFQQIVTATGRLSSSDPNLQNIPVRTEAGRKIRGCFVVGDGYSTLLTADYSQIEMRIMAHLSQDVGLIAAFAEGEDLHSTVAARVFDVDPADVDPEMRRRIKAMSYGLAYGLSSYGLGQQLGIEPGEAKVLMDEYFARFGGVRDYLKKVVDEARATGYTQTMLGRRRYLPDLTSDQRQRREMAERMALNAPIQGSAADIIKIAMIGVHERLASGGFASRLLLQVHDELVLEVAPDELDSVRDIVVDTMGSAIAMDVPLDVSVGIGRTWESAGH